MVTSKMKLFLFLTAVVNLGVIKACNDDINLTQDNPSIPENATSIYDYFAKNVDGNKVSMDIYKGKVAIIVNTASG